MDEGFIQKEESFFQKQRRLLGIPEEIANKPVLYVQTHRGLLDVKFASHREIFKSIVSGEGTEDMEKESVFIDLSESTPEQVIELLRSFGKKVDVMEKSTDGNDPLPEFTMNTILLAPLNEEGIAKKGSQTFSINKHSVGKILPELKNALEEAGALTHKLPE